MASLPTGVSYLNGNYYTGGVPQLATNNAFGNIVSNINSLNAGYAMNNPDIFNKYYKLIGAPQSTQQTQQSMSTQQIQPQLNRLTQQASNALYGGILGYNPQPMISGGQKPQSFAAPTGDFRSAFTGMQGLLGQGAPNWRGGY